jgi:hypothetical protein
MDLPHVKRTAAAAWILGAGVVGLAANVSSVPASVIFAVLGFGPPLVMLLLWNDAPQTITESIQEARR